MTTEAMRAKFEADAGPMGFDLRRQSVAVPEPWAEYVNVDTGHRWAGWQAATLAERERAAKVCDANSEHGAFTENEQYDLACEDCAADIRKGETL